MLPFMQERKEYVYVLDCFSKATVKISQKLIKDHYFMSFVVMVVVM